MLLLKRARRSQKRQPHASCLLYLQPSWCKLKRVPSESNRPTSQATGHRLTGTHARNSQSERRVRFVAACVANTARRHPSAVITWRVTSYPFLHALRIGSSLKAGDTNDYLCVHVLHITLVVLRKAVVICAKRGVLLNLGFIHPVRKSTYWSKVCFGGIAEWI